MREFLTSLFIAVVTAAIPVVTTYVISMLKKTAENAAADTDDIKAQSYIREIANAISDAVAATSQTYVDALKQAGTFTAEAQKEAAQKALSACIASISPAAQQFIETAYGDLTEYLTNKIEAEVRKQKFSTGTAATAVLESTADTTTVAASTAAATTASYLQTAINQLEAEVKAE
ncbi:MAG: hypothetical protein LUG26_07780 [Ruminococcus sp.]|nr:hypothetical protein [Ruminococcus sp.]